MLAFWIYIVATALIVFFGYLVSVFSNAIYIDPEEIETAFPQLSEKRRHQLAKFISNPRAFFQIGVLVRVTTAIILGVLGLLIADIIAVLPKVPPALAYIVIILMYWAGAVMFLIYMPRRVSPTAAKKRMLKYLPLYNFVYVLGTPLLRLFGRIPPHHRTEEIPEDQKEDIVERAIETLAETAGISSPIIEDDEKEMIHQIFQLDVTEVEEIMIPRIDIIGVPIDATMEQIQEMVGKYGFSRYPVFDDNIDHIKGVLYVKDLLLLSNNQRTDFSLGNHIREPLLVSENRKIDQLLAEFKKTKTHLAIVLDEFGGTAGLVTLEDILEEIVGEIEDEHDPARQSDIIKTVDGSFEVSGSCSLEELADELDLDLEQEEFETVGGMIYDIVGSVPTEGTSISWQNTKIKILKVQGQRILRVLVTPQPADSSRI